MLGVHVPHVNRRPLHHFQLQGMAEGADRNARELREGGGLPPEYGQAAPRIRKKDGDGARFPDSHLSWSTTKGTGIEGGGTEGGGTEGGGAEKAQK